MAATTTQNENKSPDLLSSVKLVSDSLPAHWRPMVLSLGAAILSVGLELVPIWLTFLLVSQLVDGTATTTGFLMFGGVLLVTIPTSYYLFGFATTQSHIVAFRVLFELRQRLAQRLTELPLGFFSRLRSGSARKILIDEPERLELIIAHALPEGMSAFVSWVVVTIWLFTMDWRMALASIALTPISFGFLIAAMTMSIPLMGDWQKASSRLNGAVGEYLSGISAIKIFTGNSGVSDEARESIRQFAQSQSDMGRRYVPLGGTFYALVLANVTVILPVGLWLLHQGEISFEVLLFFVILGGNYSAPLLRLFSIFNSFAHVSVAASEIQDVLDAPAQTDTGNELELENLDIQFHDVGFAYDDVDVIKNMNFCALSNQTTALVGPSGSGKSTLASLIARFYDLPAGTITIGGQDIAKMGREQLMRTVGFVFQDTFLFSGTIEDNLRFARPDASEAELHSAARAAQAHDFVMALPDGYQTNIGDGSGLLSGGERQRLAIARTILKDAPIIILDEATAFADPDCEVEIQKAISQLARGKTLVVVAHRLHTIAAADQILVLDSGKLVEQGQHAQLLEQNGLYARMWTDYMATRQGVMRATDPSKQVQS